MRPLNRWVAPWALVLALAATAAPVHAQGKGKDGDHKKDHAQKVERGNKGNQAQKADRGANRAAQAKAQGQKADKAQKNNKANRVDRGNRGASARTIAARNESGKPGPRVANAAIRRAEGRGIATGLFVLDGNDDRVRIKNRSGVVLIDLDDDRARRLGAWDVRPVNDRGDAGAPSFCRSGAGHPNWGRQWCIDKGFGLGRTSDIRWGRATTVGDIIFGQRVTTGSLARDALLGVLGELAFNRLGLHAVTLGYAEPLTGVWVADQSGPRVLQINSGTYPVAEIVDTNRDNRADLLVVALRAQ